MVSPVPGVAEILTAPASQRDALPADGAEGIAQDNEPPIAKPGTPEAGEEKRHPPDGVCPLA